MVCCFVNRKYATRAYISHSVQSGNRVVVRGTQLLSQDDCKHLFTDSNMSSLGSSQEPIEDRFSIVLSRLERIEAALSGLEDVKKLLIEIEDNTHPDGDGKSDFRVNWQDKVGFENSITY